MSFINRGISAGCVLRSFFKSLTAGGSMRMVKLLELTLQRLPLDSFAFFKASPRFSDLPCEPGGGLITRFCEKFFVFFYRYDDHGFINGYRVCSQYICSHITPPVKSIALRRGVVNNEV